MAITVALINDLRQRTNAGMMDCKKALTETNGDMDAAIKYLREKGLAIAAKRVDKESKEGIVATAAAADGSAIAIVEVNCETDFVAKTEGFVKFVNDAAKAALDGGDPAVALKDDYQMLLTKTGENVKITRFQRVACAAGAKLASYIHMGGKIGVIVEVAAGKAETLAAPAFNDLVHDLTLQIAACAPLYLTDADVPQSAIDAELEIKLNAMKEQKGKLPPEQALVGIKKGMAAKFCSEICLLSQPFVKNGPGDKTTITQLVAKIAKDLGDTVTVTRFIRFQLGAK